MGITKDIELRTLFNQWSDIKIKREKKPKNKQAVLFYQEGEIRDSTSLKPNQPIEIYE